MPKILVVAGGVIIQIQRALAFELPQRVHHPHQTLAATCVLLSHRLKGKTACPATYSNMAFEVSEGLPGFEARESDMCLIPAARPLHWVAPAPAVGNDPLRWRMIHPHPQARHVTIMRIELCVAYADAHVLLKSITNRTPSVVAMSSGSSRKSVPGWRRFTTGPVKSSSELCSMIPQPESYLTHGLPGVWGGSGPCHVGSNHVFHYNTYVAEVQATALEGDLNYIPRSISMTCLGEGCSRTGCGMHRGVSFRALSEIFER